MVEFVRSVAREGGVAIRSLKPVTTQIGQLVCHLAGDGDAKSLCEQARHVILNWIRSHRSLGSLVPETVETVPEFEVDHGGLLVQAVHLDISEEADIWAARFQHPDDEVPGRTWTVEANVARVGGQAVFGYRMSATSVPGVDAPIMFSKPCFLRDLTHDMRLMDVNVPLNGQTAAVTTPEEVKLLHRLVFDPERTLPVIVVSELPRRFYGEADQYVLDTFMLAKRLRFAAHVIRLSYQMSFEWQEMAGDNMAVYGGAVRVFWPGARRDEEDHGRHPFFLPLRVLQWTTPDARGCGVDVFVRGLEKRCWRNQLTPEYKGRFASFLEVRSRYIEVALAAASQTGNIEDELLALRRQVVLLREEKDIAEQLANEYARERDELKARAEELESEVSSLNHSIEQIRQANFVDATGGAAPLPASFDQMEGWCAKYLSGCVHVLPRAINAARRSNYSAPAQVYQTLLLLANEYRNMRLSGAPEAKEAFERQRESIGLKPISKSGGETTVTRYSAQYEVPWGQGGAKRKLEWHIGRGGGRDERYLFCVYFFWDEDSEQVVVGWMPGHLSNSLT